MVKEEYKGYTIIAKCNVCYDKRYNVQVIIKKDIEGLTKKSIFIDTETSFILKEEAEKEAINLGKNIINKNMVEF
jgi:hypothetical protein